MIVKYKTRTVFYYIGLFLTTISSSLVGRTYLFLIPYLNPILKFGAVFFFLLSFIDRRWKKSNLFVSIMAMIAILIVALVTDSNILFLYILAIILSKSGDFDKICSFLFWMNLSIFFIILAMCGIGVLNDEISIHNGVLAHSLGYAYYSSPAYSVFFLTILAYYLYSGKKHTLHRILFLLISTISNTIIYRLTTVRLTFFMYIFFLIIIMLYEYFDFIKMTKINCMLGTLMYPLMFVLSIFLSFIYTKSSILSRINFTINGRFYFNNMGFARYDVKLFGNHIITSGARLDENFHNSYFYIDCGYVKTLLGYGILVTLAILLAYAIISRHVAIRKNVKLFIWSVLVCVFAFINDPLTEIILNPLLFIVVSLIDDAKQKRLTKDYDIKTVI